MPLIHVHLDRPIHDSFRLRQVAGMFDLRWSDRHAIDLSAEVPALDEPWDIGAIVGPSGSGKTSLARAAFGDALHTPAAWPADLAILDAMGDRPIKTIVRALLAVGLGSPPSWLKPYEILSTGERFRCELARALLSRIAPPAMDGRASLPRQLLVIDEYTSVVDRTVARTASAALARSIRSGALPVRFVAVTCHEDVISWLQPDWVLDLSGPTLTRGRPAAPPTLELNIERAHRSAWKPFAPHHYLAGSLHPSAACFVGRVAGRAAVFTAVLPFPHATRPGWREHRTVCLPAYQGVGLGTRMSDAIAAAYVATGRPYFSTTSHPAMIRHRARSPLWHMHRPPGMVARPGPASRSTTGLAPRISRGRITAGFEYVGAGDPGEARRLGIIGPGIPMAQRNAAYR